MTIQHDGITDPDIHEPKGASTATKGYVYRSDGAASGEWAGPMGNSVVVVNSESDFPAAAGGVITLAANTTYVLGAAISTTNRFVVSDNTAVTGDIFHNTLTYTGTGVMFTGSDASFHIYNCRLSCDTGTVFDITDTVGNVKFYLCENVIVEQCAKWGNYDDMRLTQIRNSSCSDADQGITLSGTNGLILAISEFGLVSTNVTFVGIDLQTSITNTIEFTNLVLQAPSGGVGIKGAANSANVPSGLIATVTDCSFNSTITPLNGIANSDIRWEFRGNAGIGDSTKAVDTYLTTQETVTISTAGVFVAIGGTNWQNDVASRFTTSTAGVATYEAEVDDCFMAQGHATVSKVGGGADQLELRIAVNGTTLAKSGSVTENASPTTVSVQALQGLSENDTVQLYVANLDSTSNVVVDVASLTVTRSG